MIIEKVVSIAVKDESGKEIKPGTTVWYTKTNSEELFYGRFIGLNNRNNILMENVVTGNVVSIMPKAIDSIFPSLVNYVKD